MIPLGSMLGAIYSFFRYGLDAEPVCHHLGPYRYIRHPSYTGALMAFL
jgi:protein-S-isoprenylcysteine O-methyltransferase Ste14